MTKKNSSTQNKLIADFHGTKLTIVENNNEPYVSAKEISEAMGLAWKPQYTKLNSNRERWSVTKMVMVAQDKKKRATVCIPLRKLPGWLMTIQVNKLSNDLKPKIIQYQTECDEVLWNHWNNKGNPQPQKELPKPKQPQASQQQSKKPKLNDYLTKFDENGHPQIVQLPEDWVVTSRRNLAEMTKLVAQANILAINMLNESDLGSESMLDLDPAEREQYYCSKLSAITAMQRTKDSRTKHLEAVK